GRIDGELTVDREGGIQWAQQWHDRLLDNVGLKRGLVHESSSFPAAPSAASASSRARISRRTVAAASSSPAVIASDTRRAQSAWSRLIAASTSRPRRVGAT